ncbi:MAG: hypothetical protein J7647_06460 [Cyanobacteria bacterium SBLK]|nr:hypothetical protein [Cyanobacteria bacterium SBLK]
MSGTKALKIRVVRDYDADDLPEWLRNTAKNSGKSISQICRDAEITTAYWYSLLKGKYESIADETLKKLEKALNDRYPANWRDNENI